MKKQISSETVVAYSQCPRKAFLLLSREESGPPHEYVRILEQQADMKRAEYFNFLRQKHPKVSSYSDAGRDKSDFLLGATLKAGDLTAQCNVLTKVRSSTSMRRHHYEPTLIVGTHKITKEQRLEILFIGHVLEQMQKTSPERGTIIGADGQAHRAKLEKSQKLLRPIIETLREWIATSPADPPPVILNRHCPYCQFRNECTAKAEKDDDLSLLDRMTPRLIKHYHKKGIFTVKQLSYLFKPRRSRKRRKQAPVTFKPELQALAIRTGKIYLQELPELSRHKIELFLDLEGIPDQNFHYLIGLLICDGDQSSYYSFWADTPQDEGQMWNQFLEKVNEYPEAPIYHYGSYEPRAVEQLGKQYDMKGQDALKRRLVNVISPIFGKVYFPVRSNSLKEIGKFIGAGWIAPESSGLQSLVWRHLWEETHDEHYREILLTYNQEDCRALKLLKDELSQIRESADTLSEIDFIDEPKRQTTSLGEQVHSQFETLLKFAHSNYDKKKISFRQNEGDKEDSKEKKRAGTKKGYQGQRRRRPKAKRIVQVAPGKLCPDHNKPLRETEKISKRLIIDLTLTKQGVKKTVTEYVGPQGYCVKCHKYHIPPGLKKYGVRQLYGHGFKAWAAYQRVALHMSYGSIAEVLAEQFNEEEPKHYISVFMKDMGDYYVETEKIIIRNLLKSQFIHADETSLNIRGKTQYAWVFTDGQHTIFKLTETRESTIVHDFLENYSGILISDFYSGYDSVPCRQQKCWVHLIRDLNDDLWMNPFDTEFEMFVLEVKDLIIPIMETVQRYGLKRRNLIKFKKKVDKFYQNIITDKTYKSDLVMTYKKRFIRHQGSLFTFLEYDGTPWHNNTAENAIRHIAIQRDISPSLYESGTRRYLLLLSIRQTCRFQGKSFLKFLMSGEKDLDTFKASKRLKISVPVNSQQGKESVEQEQNPAKP